MELKELYREIVNEHNLHPDHRGMLPRASCTRDGVNPSCGDDIKLSLVFDDNGILTDGAFDGSGCAISQAATDMMLELVIGKSREEALKLADAFMDMIRGNATKEQLEMLEESAALEGIAHMPARVKCATLAWRTLKEMLTEAE